MEDKAKIAIVSTLIILLAGGGYLALTPEQIENTYICDLNNMTITYPDRFSSSMKTAYVNESGVEVSYACRVGRIYSEWRLINESDYVQNEYVESNSTEIIICDSNNCFVGEA